MTNIDPYTVPNIPVDDMNNAFYSYQNNGPQILPLAWTEPGDTRDRYDLRLLSDEELSALGWTRVEPQIPPYELLTDPNTQSIGWDTETGSWIVVNNPQPE